MMLKFVSSRVFGLRIRTLRRAVSLRGHNFSGGEQFGAIFSGSYKIIFNYDSIRWNYLSVTVHV